MKVKDKYKGNKFLAFGAAGELTVRECTEIQIGKEISLLLRGGTRGNYYYSYWPVPDVVPMNRKARRLLARLMWQSREQEFKRWRREENIRTPSLAQIEEQLRELK